MSTVFTGNPYNCSVGNGSQYSYFRLDDIILGSRGAVRVYSGGVVSKAVVNAGGNLEVQYSGTAYNVTVNNSGELGVDGLAVGISANNGATIRNYWNTDRFYVLANGAYIEKMNNFVASGNVSGLNYAGNFYASSAILKNCTLNFTSGQYGYNVALAYLRNGAIMSGGVVSGLGRGQYAGQAYLSSGCRAVGTLISGGCMEASSGATVSSIKVDGGTLVVHTGGAAKDTVVTRDGCLSAMAAVSGTILRGGSQVLSGNGIGSDTKISNGGVNIISGGIGLRTVVSQGGTDCVNGGSAVSTTVLEGGIQQVLWGTATDTEVYGSQYKSGLYCHISNTHIHPGGALIVDWDGWYNNVHSVVLEGGASMTMTGGHAGSVSAAAGAAISLDSQSGISGGNIAAGVRLNNEGTLQDLDICNNMTVSRGWYYDLRMNAGAVVTVMPGNDSASAYFSNVTVASKATLNISGGTLYGLHISGGTVNDFRLNFTSLCISDGVVNNIGVTNSYTSVFDGGALNVSSGSEGFARISGGTVNIFSGGCLSSSYIYGGDTLIGSGASAYDVSVYDDGMITIASGGCADYLALRGGVALCEGKLSHTSVYDGGVLYASSATLYGGTLSSGGILFADRLSLSGGFTLGSGSILDFVIAYRTAGEDTAVIDDFSKFSGTATMFVTISADQQCGKYILANNAIGFGNSIIVDCLEYGDVLGTLRVGGTLTFGDYTYSLSRASNVLSLVVSEGASSDAVMTYRNGQVVSAADIMTDKTIASGGEEDRMCVFNGGVANFTTVNGWGSMCVFNGGAANSTTLNSGGRMYVSNGGVADSTTVNSGGWMYVSNGGVAKSTAVAGDLRVFNGGVVDATTVNSGGWILVYSGGVADSTTVKSGGWMFVSNGGVANSTTVKSGGWMFVSNGGVANSTTVNSGGRMLVSNGGIYTGRLQIAGGATVSAYAGSIIDFDISTVSPRTAALVNDLALVKGAPNFTITVSTTQTAGVYSLADGAAAFNSTVTVNAASGSELGTLAVGGAFDADGLTFRLAKNGGALTLTVEGGAPAGVTAGDLNGDGRADIVMTITQTPHPHCGATGAWLIQADQTAAWGDLSQRNAGWSVFGTGVTDAGKTTNDIYVKSTGNVVGAWVTDDAGAVAGWVTVGEFDATTQVLGLGDFDGDGQTDLLLRNTNGAVGCYLTDGTGWNYFQSLGDEWSICAVGDLNGDGRDDVVLKHDAGFAGSWLTHSDCTMAWADLATLAEGFEIVGAGDFDGDGTSDVLLKNGNYYGAWLVQNGNAAGWMGLGDLGDVTVEQIGDFDADGRDDLRIRTTSGDLGAQLVKGADTLEWKYYGSVGSEWSTSLAAL